MQGFQAASKDLILLDPSLYEASALEYCMQQCKLLLRKKGALVVFFKPSSPFLAGAFGGAGEARRKDPLAEAAIGR